MTGATDASSGDLAGVFGIEPNTGQLSISAAGQPLASMIPQVVTVNVRVSDAAGLFDDALVSVFVSDANYAPKFSNCESGRKIGPFAENTPARPLRLLPNLHWSRQYCVCADGYNVSRARTIVAYSSTLFQNF